MSAARYTSKQDPAMKTRFTYSAIGVGVLGACLWLWREQSPPKPSRLTDRLRSATAAERGNDTIGLEAVVLEAESERRLVSEVVAGAKLPSIRFLDRLSSPIAAVSAWIRRDPAEDYEWLGLSDTAGKIKLKDEFSGDVALLAKQCSFQTITGNIQLEVDGTTDVSMEAGATISGIVALNGGGMPSRGVIVLAYPTNETPSHRSITECRRGIPNSLLTARPGPDGSFTICGVNPTKNYSLIAAGSGYAMESPIAFGVPGQPAVVLELLGVFGTVVRFVGNDGAPPKAHPGLWVGRGPRWWWDSSLFQGMGTTSVQCALLGLDDALSTIAPSLDVAMMFLGDANKDRVGPILLEGTLAGYVPINGSITASRAIDKMDQSIVRLNPAVAGWGDLDVRWTVADPSLFCAPTTQTKEIADVLLHDLANDVTYEYKLLSFPATGVVVKGVPFGKYTVSILTGARSYNYSSDHVAPVVNVGVEAQTVEFDLSALFCVDLEIIENGNRHSGEAMVEITRFNGRRYVANFVTFRGPPYRISGMAAGEYKMRLFKPFLSANPVLVGVGSTTSNGQLYSTVIIAN